MRIEIVEVRNADDGTEVSFRCECGEADGHWAGVPPAVGDVRYVELDCEDELEPGVNALLAVRQVASLRRQQGGIEITARLLSRYQEGTLLLGFDDGRLEIKNKEDAFWRVHEWYVIILGSLSLYDINL